MNNNLEHTTLHTEEVDDILGKIPGKLIRYGALIISLAILLLLVLAAFVEYPDSVQADIVITASDPPVQIKSNSDGKIERIFIGDKDSVTAGQYIACIGNAAVYDDVVQLRQWLDTVNHSSVMLPSAHNWLLGDLQPVWESLVSVVNDYQNQKNIAYYDKKIASVETQLAHYRQYMSQLKSKAGSSVAELETYEKQYRRDSLLLQKGVIAESAFETTKANYYQKRSNTQSSEAAISQTGLLMNECEQTLLDLQLKRDQEKQTYTDRMALQLNNLKNGLTTWELNYIIKAPKAGVAGFSPLLTKNNPVSKGDLICTVVSGNDTGYTAKALLPLAGSGKVQNGDKVIIKPDNFPYIDFGIVYGTVESVSLMSQENNYLVKINLPRGLTTSYGRQLNAPGEIRGRAEIITQNQSLLHRLVKPIYVAMRGE